ncbi:hypothetical protein TPDSL_13990 [Terrisporobacter petrolearius]|uniref:phage major capsid protein n=1 Tax=Terrisporobacter petrolearius TaxID=1460447 RepID=UPI003367F77D
MNKEQYLQQRNALIEEGQNLINEGKIKEFADIKNQIEQLDLDFEEGAKAQTNLNALQDNSKITNIQNKSIGVVAGATVVDSMNTNTSEDDYTNTIEYRKAFMNYVQKGISIPSEFKNVSETTKTTDIGEIIPETVLSKIIEKLEATGMILPLVTRTAYKGGVSIPTSSVKPVATWVAEGAGSDKQKKSTGEITFAYHKLRCAVANTLETEVMALPIFETTLIANVVEAMTKALEKSIISGTGTGQPKGILKETVEVEKNIEISASGSPALKDLEDAEAALPLAYENGAVWGMTKKTFMKYASLKDTSGQPIGRVNYGIAGAPERTLLGRKVVLNDYMDSYKATVEADSIVGFLFNFKDYVLNTNYNMTIKKYEDNDTDDMITKAIMLADGKVVDKNSLVTITKKSA